MTTAALILEDVDLQAWNTLALPARARYFARIETLDQLREAVSWARQKKLPQMILGGGSNLIFASNWPGLVMHIAIAGKTLEPCTGGAQVTVGAGENWHALVQWSLAQNLYGLENLTLIPGTVGAAPIQNIGAYGVEVGERLVRVRGLNFDDDVVHDLTAAECQLGYRDSIFKQTLRDRFVITEVVLSLRDQFKPVINYPTLRDALALIDEPSAQDVEAAVRQIRQSRLPDPVTLPNAGSFFKNPVIAHELFVRLQKTFPSIPSFSAPDGVKIPAAWLVEQSGWKGRRSGAVGVHAQQALVLIHYRDRGNAKTAATELLALAQSIQRDVQAQFDIALELEPRVYSAT